LIFQGVELIFQGVELIFQGVELIFQEKVHSRVFDEGRDQGALKAEFLRGSAPGLSKKLIKAEFFKRRVAPGLTQKLSL